LKRIAHIARNKINAGEKAKTAQQIVSDVLFHWQAWRDAVSNKKELQFQSANQNGDHHLKKFTRLIAMRLTQPVRLVENKRLKVLLAGLL
jgi:hypothetical protein